MITSGVPFTSRSIFAIDVQEAMACILHIAQIPLFSGRSAEMSWLVHRFSDSTTWQ